jgi:hypothetical protein
VPSSQARGGGKRPSKEGCFSRRVTRSA